VPKKIMLILILALLGGGGYFLWRNNEAPPADGPIVLYGNVDMRQVDLAFKDSERIASMDVEEGDKVIKGQILASLETDRLDHQIASLKNQIQAQDFVVQRLLNGSRSEDIQKAKADVGQAAAQLKLYKLTLKRMKKLLTTGSTTQQDVDDAQAKHDVAAAELYAAQEQLNLVLAGPRWEDIANAKATLASMQSQLALLETTRKEYDLLSPVNAVVRNRILEPGDMAAPSRPAFTLALLDPKWVRAYVNETDLGRIREGIKAEVRTDAFPGEPLAGWIGFISPMAEFTPKNVETPELRTALVYEVRVFVKDPNDRLRLGMPATVAIPEPLEPQGQTESRVREGAPS
jgi:HlyD family secretion protein